jgi:hypothetical protein
LPDSAIAVAVQGTGNHRVGGDHDVAVHNAPAEGAACMPSAAALDLLVSVPVLVASFIGPVARRESSWRCASARVR